MTTYKNPLKITTKNDEDIRFCSPLYNPDPYVIKYRGEYYCYATGDKSVPVLKSADLCTWIHLGSALREAGCWSFWAPCVVYDNGLFYMYYSSMKKNEVDNHQHLLKLAVSENPEGPFVYKKTFFSYFSIDPHVVRDKDSWKMFYSVNNVCGVDENRPGTVILEDKMTNLYTLSGHPDIAVYPTMDEEIFERNRFNDGRDWHTVEGAFFYPYHGTDFLLYSGGAYTKEYYFIDYALRNMTTGQWEKRNNLSFSPLLQKNDSVEGTGHNSITTAPNLVDQWIIYHGRNRSIPFDEKKEQRSLRIDPLFGFEKTLFVSGPTDTVQQGPLKPSFSDSFDGEPDTNNWNIVSGTWTGGNNGVLTSSSSKKASVLYRKEYSGYVMEVSFRWLPQHFGGVFGVFGAVTDEKNRLELLFDAGKKSFITRSVRNGGICDEQSVPLDTDFNPAAFHLLRVERTGSCFIVYVDGLKTVQYEYYSGDASSVGFVTYYCSVEYDAFGITGRLACTKDTRKSFWQYLRTNGNGWKSAEGILISTHATGSGQISIPDIPYESFRITFFIAQKSPNKEKYADIVLGSSKLKNKAVFTVSADGIVSGGRQLQPAPVNRIASGYFLRFYYIDGQIKLFVDQDETAHTMDCVSIDFIAFFPYSEMEVSNLEIIEIKS